MSKKIGIEALSTIDLPHSRMEVGGGGGGVGEMDIADLAGAAHTMGDVPWACFMYLYRHDESAQIMGTLRGWLTVKAVNLSISEGWPQPQRNKPETKYFQRMVDLVLLEAKEPHKAGRPEARAAWWGVSLEEWNGTWSKRYESLWERFKSLDSHARIHLSTHANADVDSADFSEDVNACIPLAHR